MAFSQKLLGEVSGQPKYERGGIPASLIRSKLQRAGGGEGGFWMACRPDAVLHFTSGWRRPPSSHGPHVAPLAALSPSHSYASRDP